MIGYPRIEDQVEHDFDRARRRAYARQVLSRLRGRGDSGYLLSFDEVKASLVDWSQSYRGLQVIEVDKIVGSVGRHREFDDLFLPKRDSSETKWKRIDRAFHRVEDLPPVSLYKIGDTYFVRDGHHRVSVARYHGVETIEAVVVEVRGETAVSLPDTPAHWEQGLPGWRERLTRWLRPRPAAGGTC